MKRRTVLQGGGSLLLLGLAGRSSAADQATRGDLAGDIGILREALALHPGLYRYNSPGQIDAAIESLSRQFASAPTLQQRYLVLSRFLSSIRCGHTYGNFFNQKKAVAAELFAGRTRLPFHFAWSGDAMVVLADPAGSIPPGSLVLSINGVDPLRMRRALMPLVRTDGHNEAKKVSLLEVRGNESIETFDVFQGLVYPPAANGFDVLLRLPGGQEVRRTLAPIDLAERQKARTSREAEGDAVVWDWNVRGDGIAVLTMPNWALYNSKWDWRAWLNERLDAAASAKGLIVDLRANEGGEDCGDLILSRLIDRDFVPPRSEQRIRFQRTPESLNPYLDTWDDSFRTLGVGAKPLANGFYLRPGGDEAVKVAASPKWLGKKVAVLIGPVNSSATFQFASNFRAIGGGRLYGETTGGNRRGINGGCYFFVRLPASKLEFDLPLVGYFPLEPQPDAGLEPEVRIVPTPADIAAGRDPVMDRAVADLLRG